MTDRLLLEAQRVERAIGRVRWGAAAITLLLGPLFPTLSIEGVYTLGAGIVIYNVSTLAASRRATSRRTHAAVARAAFAGDIAALAAAMVLFSADPQWTTYILGPLVITTGAFRFGTGGTLAASLALGAGYTATAAFRDRAFGHTFEPERVLFNLSVYALTAVLVDRVMRDARQLRTERPIEYNLLYHLATNAGRVMPHETLLAKVWGTEYRNESHYLKVYVGRLRNKLEPDPQTPRYILTVRGVGYQFPAPE